MPVSQAQLEDRARNKLMTRGDISPSLSLSRVPWRAGIGVPGALRGSGGDESSQRRGNPQLRSSLQPRREPDRQKRQRVTETEVLAQSQ